MGYAPVTLWRNYSISDMWSSIKYWDQWSTFAILFSRCSVSMHAKHVLRNLTIILWIHLGRNRSLSRENLHTGSKGRCTPFLASRISNHVRKYSQPLTYNRTGLLDRPETGWSQDGGNMRVFAHEVTCWPVLFCIFLYAWRASDVQTTLIFVSIVTFNWPRITSGKKYWSSSPVLLYVNVLNQEIRRVQSTLLANQVRSIYPTSQSDPFNLPN